MRILFADDMETNRFLVSYVLKEFGYDIETFTDGDDLLDRSVSEPRPDIIISDKNMLRIGGLEVLSQIKNNSRYAEIKSLPIIVYTDEENEDTRLEIEELGGVLVKKEIKDLVLVVKAAAAKIEKERR
jgi:CheY-like chemotaxis protein